MRWGAGGAEGEAPLAGRGGGQGEADEGTNYFPPAARRRRWANSISHKKKDAPTQDRPTLKRRALRRSLFSGNKDSLSVEEERRLLRQTEAELRRCIDTSDRLKEELNKMRERSIPFFVDL